MHQAITVL